MTPQRSVLLFVRWAARLGGPFASLDPDAWPTVAIAACRLAVSTSEVEDSSAVSALPVALSLEPDEAICEAAYAVGTPEELMRCLAS